MGMFPGGVPGSGIPSPAAYANTHASQFSNFNGQLQLQPGNLGGMSKSPGLDGSNPSGLDAPTSMASAYSDFSSQSPFFSQYPAQYGINMGSYNATYASTTQPGTQATNPFAAAGQIPHVSSSQSALAIGQSARPDQEVTPPPTAARTVPSPGATSVPTATSSMPGTTNPLSFEGNPYALYSSY